MYYSNNHAAENHQFQLQCIWELQSEKYVDANKEFTA